MAAAVVLLGAAALCRVGGTGAIVLDRRESPLNGLRS